MINKKGISAVVATVLIILITVAAVTIVWAVVIPMIRNTITEGDACLKAVQAITISNACYNGSNVQFVYSRGAGDVAVNSIQIIGYKTTGDSIDLTTTTILPTTANSQTTIVTNGDTTIKQLAIAPKVTVGNTLKTCEPLQKLTVASSC